MYFTKENIDILNSIILNLNHMENKEELQRFLDEHVEDSSLLLNTLKKVNKRKISIGTKKEKQIPKNMISERSYTEHEILEIFSQKDNNTIMSEFSLADLRAMYTSVYKRKAPTNYTKKKITDTFRDRFYTMDRAKAFQRMSDERCKKPKEH